jgi:hypothetical protein
MMVFLLLCPVGLGYETFNAGGDAFTTVKNDADQHKSVDEISDAAYRLNEVFTDNKSRRTCYSIGDPLWK